jgi:hypothetical protein
VADENLGVLKVRARPFSLSSLACPLS